VEWGGVRWDRDKDGDKDGEGGERKIKKQNITLV
jgi:hypothetical protein